MQIVKMKTLVLLILNAVMKMTILRCIMLVCFSVNLTNFMIFVWSMKIVLIKPSLKNQHLKVSIFLYVETKKQNVMKIKFEICFLRNDFVFSHVLSSHPQKFQIPSSHFMFSVVQYVEVNCKKMEEVLGKKDFAEKQKIKSSKTMKNDKTCVIYQSKHTNFGLRIYISPYR